MCEIRVLTTDEVDNKYFYLKGSKAAALTYNALYRGDKIVSIDQFSPSALNDALEEVKDYLSAQYEGSAIKVIQFTDFETNENKAYCAVRITPKNKSLI